MHIGRTIALIALLAVVAGGTSGCYSRYGSFYPNAGVWNAAAVQTPQRVRFFYGYIVDVRRVPVAYHPRARFEPNWEPEGRHLVQVLQQYPEPTPVVVPPGYRNPCPSRVCEGIEYTVMLDKATMPPDQFLHYGQHPAVIVVQNIAQTEAPMLKGTRVVVRTVNNSSAKVMAAATLPRFVGGINVESALSAGPMPIPLWYRQPPPVPLILLPPCGEDRPCDAESVAVSP